MSVCRGWILGCLVVACLQQRATASAQHQLTTDHPPPGVTCYTCVNVSDNLVCNQFAIDRPCPQGEDFCHTLHVMDSRGDSVVVNKKCTSYLECTPQRVGCVDIDAQKICVSCCDEMYCNVAVPTNLSNAVYSSKRPHAVRAEDANSPTRSCSGWLNKVMHIQFLLTFIIII